MTRLFRLPHCTYPRSSALSCFLPLLAFAQKVEPTPENISKGEAIYKKHCQMCHGATGMGDGPAGKRMNPKPYNFQDKEKMAAETDEHLLKEITKGKARCRRLNAS